MQLRPDHLAQVRACVVSALGRETGVTVRIVGSYARGEQVRSSDLDVLVDAGAPLDFAALGRLNEAFEESDLPFVVDLVDYHRVAATRREGMLAGSLAVLPGSVSPELSP